MIYNRKIWVPGSIALVSSILVAAFLLVRALLNNSLDRADYLELTMLYRRWVEAGRPTGGEAGEFMRGRRNDVIMTNRMILVDGSNYVSQFAITAPHSRQNEVLFVSTNGVMIWLGGAKSGAIVTWPP